MVPTPTPCLWSNWGMKY